MMPSVGAPKPPRPRALPPVRAAARSSACLAKMTHRPSWFRWGATMLEARGASSAAYDARPQAAANDTRPEAAAYYTRPEAAEDL